jgi:hypothetical protein
LINQSKNEVYDLEKENLVIRNNLINKSF